MPNHLHALIDFGKSAQSINSIVSNGKRFMAYTIVERLKEHNHDGILKQLSEAVNPSDKDKGKIHQVFERSFDCKEIHQPTPTIASKVHLQIFYSCQEDRQ